MNLTRSVGIPAKYESIYQIHHQAEKCVPLENLGSNHMYHNQQYIQLCFQRGNLLIVLNHVRRARSNQHY